MSIFPKIKLVPKFVLFEKKVFTKLHVIRKIPHEKFHQNEIQLNILSIFWSIKPVHFLYHLNSDQNPPIENKFDLIFGTIACFP